MQSFDSITDVIFHKFLGGRLAVLLASVGMIFLLFDFTGIGFWAYGVAKSSFIELIQSQSNPLTMFVKAFGFLFLIIPGFLISIFAFFISYMATVLSLMLFITSLTKLFCLISQPPKILNNLLTYEQWEANKWRQLNNLNKTQNYFETEILKKVKEPDDFFTRYLIEKNTVEYVAAYSEMITDQYHEKLHSTNTLVNLALKTLPFQISGLFGGCEHGIADEVFCNDCFKSAKQRQEIVKNFIERYRAEQKHFQYKKIEKKTSSTFDKDLSLLELTQPFTLEELKKKRNRALKINHPDLAAGMDKDVQDFAKKQTQNILEAYKRLEQMAEK